jgi:hypothetical protein
LAEEKHPDAIAAEWNRKHALARAKEEAVDRKDAERYRFWRKEGIEYVWDARVREFRGEELDYITDTQMRERQ